jgi:hypothetical protein
MLVHVCAGFVSCFILPSLCALNEEIQRLYMCIIKIKKDYVFWDTTHCNLSANVTEEPAAFITVDCEDKGSMLHHHVGTYHHTANQ